MSVLRPLRNSSLVAREKGSCRVTSGSRADANCRSPILLYQQTFTTNSPGHRGGVVGGVSDGGVDSGAGAGDGSEGAGAAESDGAGAAEGLAIGASSLMASSFFFAQPVAIMMAAAHRMKYLFIVTTSCKERTVYLGAEWAHGVESHGAVDSSFVNSGTCPAHRAPGSCLYRMEYATTADRPPDKDEEWGHSAFSQRTVCASKMQNVPVLHPPFFIFRSGRSAPAGPVVGGAQPLSRKAYRWLRLRRPSF